MTTHPDDITLAARAMTGIEPPSDLEQKIKHRLDAEVPTRPTTWRWPVVTGAAAVAATVIIAVTVRSPEVPKSRGPEVPESPSSEVVQPPVTNVVVVPPPNRAGLRDLGTSGLRDLGTPTRRSSEAELAWMSRRIPALEVIDPLAMDRLSVDSIQPDALLITPLTITPLVTSPVHGDPDAGGSSKDF